MIQRRLHPQAGRELMDARGPVTSARSEIAAVGAEDNVVHVALIFKTEDLFLRPNVPEARCPIAACTRDPKTVRRKSGPRDCAAMYQRRAQCFALQLRRLRAGRELAHFPHARRAAIAFIRSFRGDDAFSRTIKLNVREWATVMRKSGFRVAPPIPHSRFTKTVALKVTCGNRDQSSVRRKRRPVNRLFSPVSAREFGAFK